MKISDEDLNTFLESYIATALWSSTAYGYNKDPDDDQSFESANFDIDALSEDCLKSAREDCLSFMQESWGMIKNDLSQAGHDFWLTRCGHGAGFWYGDWKEHGATLTNLSKPYGNVDLYYGDDEKIHGE